MNAPLYSLNSIIQIFLVQVTSYKVNKRDFFLSNYLLIKKPANILPLLTNPKVKLNKITLKIPIRW